MKKSRKFAIVCACLVAFSLIAVALCFIFVGTDEVTEVPQNITVEQVDGETCLVTDFSSKWTYRFQIEQQIDGQFCFVEEIVSDVNNVALSSCQVSFVAGCAYRFSACYANGNLTGSWSQKVIWTATWSLSAPENLTQAEGKLSWDEVSDAEGYYVCCVDGSGNEITYTVLTNSFDLSTLDSGNYQIYVQAFSSNQFIQTSDHSSAFSWSVE